MTLRRESSVAGRGGGEKIVADHGRVNAAFEMLRRRAGTLCGVSRHVGGTYGLAVACWQCLRSRPMQQVCPSNSSIAANFLVSTIGLKKHEMRKRYGRRL